MNDVAPILLMAVVAVVVCMVVVGITLSRASPTYGLIACLMLGAIVATTDPAAVIGIFREIGAPRRLTMLVEGESLLNDAAAIALFGMLAGMLIGGQEAAWGGVAVDFLVKFLGGAADRRRDGARRSATCSRCSRASRRRRSPSPSRSPISASSSASIISTSPASSPASPPAWWSARSAAPACRRAPTSRWKAPGASSASGPTR